MKTRVLLLLVTFVASGRAEEMKASDAKMKETLQAVVQKQLEAFRAGDYPAAYAFADVTIKAQFPVEEFATMVKKGYPAIAKSVSATFGLTFDNGVDATVVVRVIGDDKLATTFQYVLKRTGEDWRIAGVLEVKPQEIEV